MSGLDERAIRADLAIASSSTLAGLDATDRVLAAVPELLDDRDHWRRVAHALQERLDERQEAAERADRNGEHLRLMADVLLRPGPAVVIPAAVELEPTPTSTHIAYVRADGTPETEQEYRARLERIRAERRRSTWFWRDHSRRPQGAELEH